ncbi:hypothetical protein CIHG_05250 [Coccidioides immitis H538.4]|uniref:Uncharacterized protein n=1 Tax=Coccidioides immitis H538.4 TaxID=396776 RepID=A0A0J8RQT4_COCIT|nr:hypothetical protein CIHG_05250 [Coccidioides immitis H538.4]
MAEAKAKVAQVQASEQCEERVGSSASAKLLWGDAQGGTEDDLKELGGFSHEQREGPKMETGCGGVSPRLDLGTPPSIEFCYLQKVYYRGDLGCDVTQIYEVKLGRIERT